MLVRAQNLSQGLSGQLMALLGGYGHAKKDLIDILPSATKTDAA